MQKLKKGVEGYVKTKGGVIRTRDHNQGFARRKKSRKPGKENEESLLEKGTTREREQRMARERGGGFKRKVGGINPNLSWGFFISTMKNTGEPRRRGHYARRNIPKKDSMEGERA